MPFVVNKIATAVAAASITTATPQTPEVITTVTPVFKEVCGYVPTTSSYMGYVENYYLWNCQYVRVK